MNKHVKLLEASNGWNSITHQLHTTDVIVAIYDLSNYMLIETTVQIKDENTLLVIFGSPIEDGRYRVVIIG